MPKRPPNVVLKPRRGAKPADKTAIADLREFKHPTNNQIIAFGKNAGGRRVERPRSPRTQQLVRAKIPISVAGGLNRAGKLARTDSNRYYLARAFGRGSVKVMVPEADLLKARSREVKAARDKATAEFRDELRQLVFEDEELKQIYAGPGTEAARERKIAEIVAARGKSIVDSDGGHARGFERAEDARIFSLISDIRGERGKVNDSYNVNLYVKDAVARAREQAGGKGKKLTGAQIKKISAAARKRFELRERKVGIVDSAYTEPTVYGNVKTRSTMTTEEYRAAKIRARDARRKKGMTDSDARETVAKANEKGLTLCERIRKFLGKCTPEKMAEPGAKKAAAKELESVVTDSIRSDPTTSSAKICPFAMNASWVPHAQMIPLGFEKLMLSQMAASMRTEYFAAHFGVPVFYPANPFMFAVEYRLLPEFIDMPLMPTFSAILPVMDSYMLSSGFGARVFMQNPGLNYHSGAYGMEVAASSFAARRVGFGIW